MITDRAQVDVDRWLSLRKKGVNMTADELEEFIHSKGAYNATDLNRVENAVKELSDYLKLGLVTKTDWSISDIPTREEMTRYLNNIKKVARALKGGFTLPESMDYLTYQGANDIEKTVEQLIVMKNSIAYNWFYPSELFTGEV